MCARTESLGLSSRPRLAPPVPSVPGRVPAAQLIAVMAIAGLSFNSISCISLLIALGWVLLLVGVSLSLCACVFDWLAGFVRMNAWMN